MASYVKILFLLLFSTLSFGSEVLQITSSGKFLVVSQEVDAHFKVGDYVCVLDFNDTETACGFITISNSFGAVVNLQFQTAEIRKRNKVAYAITSKPTADFPDKPDPSNIEESISIYKMLFNEESADRIDTPEKNAGQNFNLIAGTNILNPSIELQTALDSHYALGFQLGFYQFSKSNLVSPAELKGFLTGGTIGFNYYMLDSFKGLWLRAGGGYYIGTITYKTQSDNPGAMTAFATVGYRWLKDHFNFGASAGAQYMGVIRSEAITYNIQVISPVISVDFGWVF